MKKPIKGLKVAFFSSGSYLVMGALLLVAKVLYSTKIVPMMSEELFIRLSKPIFIGFVLFVALFVHKIVGNIISWYKDYISGSTKTTADDELIPLLRRVINSIIWIIAALVILPLYGVKIGSLLTTLGFGSLAVALAAKDTFAKIIAGIWIMVDRPFKLGDKIKLPSGEVVIVKDIGLRDSRFLGNEKNEPVIIIVPNVELSNKKIINFTYGGKFRVPVSEKKKKVLRLKGGSDCEKVR